jgi:hypothetical protein
MRLREIGADGRIYDLMDSQVSIIEAGCGEPALSDAGTALTASFELIERRISEAERDDAAPDDHTPPDTAAASRPDDIVAAPVEAALEAAATQDDAVLDMIALEMAAPDFAEHDAAEFCVPGYDPVAPVAVARATAPADAAEPIPQLSLGASLIANGIVRTPATSAGDPLAPIRRMSQAEKIAFFS